MPNTREKLIKLFEDIDCPAHWMFPNNAEILKLADYLIANGVTVQEWIPVTERLPEHDKAVLCYKSDRGIRFGKIMDATYADGVQAFMDCDRRYAFGATHWMPLPQLPKEG